MEQAIDRPTTGRLARLGVAVVLPAVIFVAAALVYGFSARAFDAGRGDFFYLAEAFLHGRTWLPTALGPWDVVQVGDRVYVPFAPFPAVALMPLVAAVGPLAADRLEPVVNGLIGGADVLLCWWLLGRVGVERLRDRAALVILFGFSTPIWWVATRGGVWHTGHLIALFLTLAGLIEAFGRRRPLLLGLFVGAAFLTRAPVVFAGPFFAWVAASSAGVADLRAAVRAWPRWALVGLGFAPAIAFFLWYNAVRFGSPFESGYALASLPEFLEIERAKGLFSIVHIPTNLRYLLLEVPTPTLEPPFLRPDGYGLSVLLASPGLVLALRAPWHTPMARALAITAALVLLPSLLYYGGGWFQLGYRYALDSLPFVIALAGLAVAGRPIGRWGYGLIGFGVAVGLWGVYWAYNA